MVKLLFGFSELAILASSASCGPTTIFTADLTCIPTPLMDVPSTTFPVTLPGQPGGTAAPVIGQPKWDYSNLDSSHDGPLTLSISTSSGNKSSPLLYGLMPEDINHSIDGGLYAELIQNRAFQNSTLEGWYSLQDSCIYFTEENPLSDALLDSLKAEIQRAGDGLANEGWWGLSVRPVEFKLSFWARVGATSNFRVKISLVLATDRSREWVAQDLHLTGGSSWTYYETTLTPSSSAPDTNNLFIISALTSGPETVQFNLLSLFPPTWKSRPNGVRLDLMQNLIDLNLKIVAFLVEIISKAKPLPRGGNGTKQSDR